MNRPRYWIGVASRDHVLKGVGGGFAQVCHGKCGPLRRMRAGDWIVYYSPATLMKGGEPCRAFTAIGRVIDGRAYEFDMGNGFVPYRTDVAFLNCTEAPIVTLLEQLTFLPDKKRWGFPFRRGHFEIGETDFRRIADALGVTTDDANAQLQNSNFNK